jgi:hypothetical protein
MGIVSVLGLNTSQSPSTEPASLDSPTLVGTPIAPTAAPGTADGQVATTGFVAAAISSVGSSGPAYAIALGG